MFLDLDCFKSVNDEHGHAAGDAVLKEVAQRLLEHARDEDAVCRNGGDEFLYLLVNPQGRDNIERIARRVLDEIAWPIVFEGRRLAVRPSIGIAVYPDNGTTHEALVRSADAAMYRAKKSAAGCVFFDAPEPLADAADVAGTDVRQVVHAPVDIANAPLISAAPLVQSTPVGGD